MPYNWALSSGGAHTSIKICKSGVKNAAAPTTRLTLQEAGTLSSGHLKLLRKPSKRRNGPIFTMTKARNDGQRFREMRVATRNIGGVAQKIYVTRLVYILCLLNLAASVV